MACHHNGVGWVHSDLVLRRIADQPFCVGESHVGWGSSVTLIVGYDFNTIVLPHADARVRRSQIDSDSRTLAFSSHTHSHTNNLFPLTKLEFRILENLGIKKLQQFLQLN